jgi:hypothetical protein
MKAGALYISPVSAQLALRAESSVGPSLLAPALVALLSVVGLVLRLPGLDESITGDELFTYEVALRPGLDDVLSGVSSDLEISPPLYFLVAWATAKIGDPGAWLRIPSCVASVATIPAVYFLGTRTVGRPAAMVGAALFTLSPFAVFYGTEARPYALTTLFVVLSTIGLSVALERGRWLHWALFGLATWAALLTHYTAAFPVAVQAGWAVWAHRDRLRELGIAFALVALALTPWLPSFMDDRHAGFQTAIETYWPLTTSFFFKSLVGWLVGNPYVGLSSVPGTAALVLIAIGLALAVSGVKAALVALRRPEAMLVVVLAVTVPLAALLYSLPFASVFVPRSLLPALPALCLVLALLLTSGPQTLAAVATALVVAGLAVGTARLISWTTKPPFRAAAEYIDERGGTGDPIIATVLDLGSLETELRQPFAVYRAGCVEPLTQPGQLLNAEVRCTGTGEQTMERASKAARGRLFVLSPRAAPPPQQLLEGGWEPRATRELPNRYFPYEVTELVRR